METKKKKTSFMRLNRKVHYWGALIISIPLIIVVASGILLQVKKQFTWVQPPTVKGVSKVPELSFDKILQIASQVDEGNIKSWKDIDRLDVRPKKGVVKVRAKNSWEIQIDNKTGDILQVEYRRSDIIEAIHDGSFFHEHAKLWLFLPASIILLVLWATGVYLFAWPYITKSKKRKRLQEQAVAVQAG